MKQTRFFMLVAMMMICGVSSMTAQPNREQMAQISVDKEGNFKYWNAEALSLMQLKQFVADVTAEGSEMIPGDR